MKTMIAIAMAGAAGVASAQSVTWMPNIELFGGATTGSGGEELVWSETFSIGGAHSIDSIELDIAHDYAGDLVLRLINTTTSQTFYIFGTEAAVNGTSSIFDGDGLGVSPYNLASVASYVLVESGGSATFITGTSGTVAAGTYNGQGWASGVFGASSWTIELWDTWASVDEGSLASATVNYTIIPTPASAAMLGLGGLVALRRRR